MLVKKFKGQNFGQNLSNNRNFAKKIFKTKKSQKNVNFIKPRHIFFSIISMKCVKFEVLKQC